MKAYLLQNEKNGELFGVSPAIYEQDGIRLVEVEQGPNGVVPGSVKPCNQSILATICKMDKYPAALRKMQSGAVPEFEDVPAEVQAVPASEPGPVTPEPEPAPVKDAFTLKKDYELKKMKAADIRDYAAGKFGLSFPESTTKAVMIEQILAQP